MPKQSSLVAQLILNMVRNHSSIKIEELIWSLPGVRWREVFAAVALLERKKKIVLTHHGLDYKVRPMTLHETKFQKDQCVR